jgi:ATP-dependent exoDNAse (exonuclease V) beta subunit
VTVRGIDQRKAEIAQRHAMAVAAGWAHTTVTKEAKRPLELPEPDQELRRLGKGREWGRAVHRVLEARMRGRTGASLERFARAVAADEEVEDVAGLLALVARVETDGHFADAAAILAETPIVRLEQRETGTVLLEGVIDAARLVDGEWRIVDWKTDLDDSDANAALRAQYQEQVDTYARMLTSLLKVNATGTLVGVAGVTPPS